MTRRGCTVAAALACASMLHLGGCTDTNNLTVQARRDPYEPSAVFADGASARRPVPGTVAPRVVSAPDSLTTVQDLLARLGSDDARLRFLREGRERFGIYCTPCHGDDGLGHGMVVRRGFPGPPSLHSARIRTASDRHVWRILSGGLGKMPSYAHQVPPEDRWKIIAYLRVLERSRRTPVGTLGPDERRRLDRESDDEEGP